MIPTHISDMPCSIATMTDCLDAHCRLIRELPNLPGMVNSRVAINGYRRVVEVEVMRNISQETEDRILLIVGPRIVAQFVTAEEELVAAESEATPKSSLPRLIASLFRRRSA